ncbi:MAG: hypothetical protein ACYC1K_03475 [Minisyncoccota bacterium]
MYLNFHPQSAAIGAAVMAVWMGSCWYSLSQYKNDQSTDNLIKAIESENSRLVTVTFADGSQILRVPGKTLPDPPVLTKKDSNGHK